MVQAITREQITGFLNENKPITIIEALPKSYYDSEHLPRAINIPHDEIRQKIAKYVEDVDAFIVVYCASNECQNSKIAANILEQMGYKK